MTSVLRVRLAGFFVAVALVASPSHAAALSVPDLAQAEALLLEGQAEAAWRMLEPHEFDRAGQQDFDYLLGVAALESGRNDRASFILERVVGVNPYHAAARLDLARALFALQDYDRANQELLAAQGLDPPEAARQTIKRYLEAIEDRRSAGRIRRSAYIELGFGTDSNVNAGVSGGRYYMPVLAAFLTSEKRRVDYEQMNLGAEIAVPDDSGGELFAGVDMKRRQHRHWVIDSTRVADYYDTRSFEGRLGFQQKIGGSNVLRLTGSRARQTLDDKKGYRSLQSLMAEWRHTLDSATQGSLWLMDQRSRYGYVDTSYRQYGGDQLLAGAGLVRAFGEAKAVVVHVTAYGGSERATDRGSGNLDGDKLLTGLRLGGQMRVLEDVDLTATVGGALTRYELYNTLFYNHRRDYSWEATLGMQWKLGKDWTLKPQYAYTRSDSNFGAYDYDRSDYSIILRYDFR